MMPYKSIRTHKICPDCHNPNKNNLWICETCGVNLCYEFIEETPLGSSQEYERQHLSEFFKTEPKPKYIKIRAVRD